MEETPFITNSYIKKNSTKVLSVVENKIQLAETIFYPRGGGQPSDSGVVTTKTGDTFSVKDVIKDDNKIFLCFDSEAIFRVEENVECFIDWDRRYTFMRYHTALHLLGTLMKYPVTSSSISLEKARLDFDAPQLSITKEEITEKLQQLADGNHEIEYTWVSQQYFQTHPELGRGLFAKPSAFLEKIRLVKIGDIDLQACGGTHVKNTCEIGTIIVKKIEKKGKQNRRVNITLTH